MKMQNYFELKEEHNRQLFMPSMLFVVTSLWLWLGL